MDRRKVGKLILLFLALPFAAYMLINFIAGYIPPTESYKKTPDQFEEAFNAQMAQYGMSIDIDSVNFSYGDDLKKVVPVVCEDGSKITCIYYPTSERSKALINYIVFEQELTEEGATVYIEPLLRFLLDEFETVMLENKDKSLGPSSGVSYNEALRRCQEFVKGDKDKEKFFVYPEQHYGTAVTLKRETNEVKSLSVNLFLFDFQ
jgi:hypothetical protein